MYIVYGKDGCPYCTKAVLALLDAGKEFTYMKVSKQFLTNAGFKTYPQIFLTSYRKEEHIGGYSELQVHLHG